ncbi:hypothetical protein PHJA_002389100 [Phtheirospermum japonicum]|uniref:ATP-dependent DNA helicase n=1 Tax=Phtheirospermum japonicum TaxID=374723 RepID=A0A830D7R6_9LAMI|nr:hypothetical protein PHJA_002389100 [Phtheirospermum japonicum]
MVDAHLIIWDETPMMHNHYFETLDKTLKNVMTLQNNSNTQPPFAETQPFNPPPCVGSCGGALFSRDMKSRLAASIYLFSAGTCRRNTRSTVSLRSVVTSLVDRHCQINRSFRAQVFEGSNRHVHSSAIEDDGFSELGPEVSEYRAKQIKLVTEKPHYVVKKNHSKRELDGRPVSSCTRPSPKAIIATMAGNAPTSNPKLGGHSRASVSTDDDAKKISDIESAPTSNPKLGGHSRASMSTDDYAKKISDIESPRSILVKNIVSKVSLSELVESISVFGKVSGASFVAASNGLRSCNIEFEDVDSSTRAVSAGKIAVGSQEFPVHPLDAVDIVAVRIENVNEETSDYAIHSRCKTVGEFVGLARTSKDVVEAFFNVRHDTNHLNILKLLNNTVIDRNNWSAHVVASKPAISNSSEISSDGEARYKLGMEILDRFSELRKQIIMKRMFLDDLETLNASIMHMEDLPEAVDLSSSK